MSRFSPEERQRIMAESDQHLAEADTRSPYELASADVIEVTPWGWESESDRNDRLYRYGIRLSDPYALEKWRADEEARERRFEQEREAERAEERRVIRARQEAAERAAAREAEPFTELQVDVLGAVIAEERHRGRQERKAELDKLRAELSVSKAQGDKMIDVTPAPLIRKPNNYAA